MLSLLVVLAPALRCAASSRPRSRAYQPIQSTLCTVHPRPLCGAPVFAFGAAPQVDANALFISEPVLSKYTPPVVKHAAAAAAASGAARSIDGAPGSGRDSVTGQLDTLYLGGNTFKGVRTAYLGVVGLLGGFALAMLLRCLGGGACGGGDDGEGKKDEAGVDLVQFEGQRQYGGTGGGSQGYQSGRYGEPAGANAAAVAHQQPQLQRQTPRHQYDVLDSNGQAEDEFNKPFDDYADVEM